ncbi:MAG: hypothetical protein LKG14_07730 [Prevotella sp.]|jgi:nicotinic acid mononucleotide adenylyltransferase|uniref:Uncharacterized protein n=1 Tax=Segatella cerevisiae TaxID=2053716 RepID=A0ABT1BYQ3_9BACT|nr:hypothetical protein [Segatella cerevisiae]MCH3994822.1 hypothetical protein [Prevotella sp.]MCI1247251.1 hypothetical protein [Prevotella sp.]MCO6026216.1 hypothetical protein [Segatella cerevisiae]
MVTNEEKKSLEYGELEDRLEMAQLACAENSRCFIGRGGGGEVNPPQF